MSVAETPSHCLKVERLQADDSLFVLLAVYKVDSGTQKQLSPRLYSLVTANWVSSLVHAVCQPTHVMQNVAELIEIQHNAGEIVGEPLPRYIDMLRMATVQANEQLGAVKLQFREFTDEPERIDLAPRLREFAQVIGCDLEGDQQDAYVKCDHERLEMLLECLAALATYDGLSSDGSRASPSLTIRPDATDIELSVRFADAVPCAEDVLQAQGDDILPTAICRVCVNLVDGFFGRIRFADVPTKHTVPQTQHESSPAASMISGVTITLPRETVNVDNRLPRAVRRIW